MSPAFVSGVELSRRFYQSVRPLLPHVPHTAALIGPGSEILGFDTERSTDHDWGPRLQLFLSAEDLAAHGDAIRARLDAGLPDTVAGHATTVLPERGVVVAELGAWLTGRLGFDPRDGVTTRDWLATPAQALAEVTAGVVHHDGLDRLHRVRESLAWYPDEVWRYVLACQWQRIGQEEHFVGRCGEVGDELGSAVVAARLARDLMRLVLLMNRRYPPYSKWLGTAFARLPGVDGLRTALTAALTAANWHAREHHLVVAYETVARMHNDLGLTDPLDARVRFFFDRPFRVIGGGRFARALAGDADRPLIGTVDQFADNTDLLSHADRARVVGTVI
ncbi:DUF4037 domain-containing protein [Actinoplanes flavus]|uniref:DUF4037 domain-containing protein n=1 Tax=Actinoplanes flavus TaxID=2820290 RepID=A0ABS3UEY1_9ACTN|nr:DUF4037 domain-containing protein [Actinoplanes flavus]MBO3737329.1 DUF4037 domain-containing protein [Actinoplanes flavus]